MTASAQVAMSDYARPCPVCDQEMELSKVETVPWATRTSGERLVFRCAKCGLLQTEWHTIPVLSSPSPEIAPSE
jgi:C4-type Zn-finger protein